MMIRMWPPTKEIPTLDREEAHIWLVDLVRAAPPLCDIEKTLTAQERHRASLLLREHSRQQFVRTRFALRALLGNYLEIDPADVGITADRNQKPHLADTASHADLRFNVSHSGDRALIALVLGRDVGVDIERLRFVNNVEQLASRYFHSAELDAIRQAPQSERSPSFLHFWTAKEAVLKALGSGVSTALASFAIPGQLDHSGALIKIPDSHGSSREFWVRGLDVSLDYVAAVAAAKEPLRCRCMAFALDGA